MQKTLISFESGHYKTVRGKWKGDSVWCHFYKKDGGMIHVNKDKVEYMESWPSQPEPLATYPTFQLNDDQTMESSNEKAEE